MEFFINSNITWILDYYKYYHCIIEFIKYLCGN